MVVGCGRARAVQRKGTEWAIEQAGAEQTTCGRKGREQRRELGHRAGQSQEGEEEEAGPHLGWPGKGEKKNFQE